MLQRRVPTTKRSEGDRQYDEVHKALSTVHEKMLCKTEDSVERLLGAWQELGDLPVQGLPLVLRSEWQSIAGRVNVLKADSFKTTGSDSIGEAADVITILLCMEYATSRAARDSGALRLLGLVPAKRG